MSHPILVAHRLRQMERPFGWIPLSLVREGTFAALSAEAKVLYCLLCIISDRRGVSFYGDAQLQRLSGLRLQDLERARHELMMRDLIAVDAASKTVQLLSLPSKHQGDGCGAIVASPSHQPRAAGTPADTQPQPSTEQHLLAVRKLIQTLSTDKRPETSRSPNHATQTAR